MSKPQPAATPATKPDNRRRYPGVRSFEEQDRKLFFGRSRATEELLLRVLSVRLLLQFAPSGVGKTSLLNAGLFPELRRRNFIAFVVRLNEEKESLTQAATRSLKDAANRNGLQEPVIAENADTLWDLLAGTQLWSPDLLLLTPVLVFDQFEEIFTLRDEAFRKRFAEEIGALSLGRKMQSTRNSLPGRLEIDSHPPDIKIIISLREEYLGKLEELSTGIPDLFHERLRLAPLSADDAKAAMVEPARLEGDAWDSPRFEFEPTCLAALIDFIGGTSEKVKVIESLTLQLVCQRAEEIAKRRNVPQGSRIELRLDDFGGLAGLNHLVRNYFETELSKLGRLSTRKRAREMFEQGLLDPSGKRLMLEQDEIARSYGLDTAALNELVESRLLRREPRNESVFYEISHDRLAEAITKNRKRKLPRWVKPTIAAGVAVILMVTALAYRANEARSQAEAALGVLLGEDLVSRLRETGLTDALQRVLADASIDESSRSFALALSLRHQGDILLDRGTLEEARQKFTKSLEVLDALQSRAGGSSTFLEERARTLKRIGYLFENSGEMSKAEQSYQEAIQAWAQLLQGNVDPQKKLDASETWGSLGFVQTRMGDLKAAEVSFSKALQIALEVLTVAFDRAQAGDPEVFFEQGRAMQTYADSALGLSSVWSGDEQSTQGAHALAREALRLRPLSSVARVQVGAASVRYGLEASLAVTPKFDLVTRLFRESKGQFDELTRWDPYNRRLQRINAAVQLLTSEATAMCAENPACKKTLAPGALEDAELAALDSIGHFRMLARLDPGNQWLKHDIVLSLQSRSKVLAALGRDNEALDLLSEALRQTALAVVDDSDIYRRLAPVGIFYEKAQLLEQRGRLQEALGALDDALVHLGPLPDQSPIVRLNRIKTVSFKIDLLKNLNRTDEAHKLGNENAQLAKLTGEPSSEKKRRALEANDAGVVLHEHATTLSGGTAITEFRRSLAKYQEAIEEYPFEPRYWENLRKAYQAVADIDRELEATAGTNEVGAQHSTVPAETYAHDRESALRGALTAAWMARVLSEEKNAAAAGRELYQARVDLDQFLYEHKHIAEVLPLVAQQVLDAEEYARQAPQSPEALVLLADANVGLGMLRFEAKYDGWEEALRKGLAYGTQLTKKESIKAERQLWIGEWRRTLGDYLRESAREDEAAQEYVLALNACRQALTLKTTEEERKRVLACMDDLAARGYK